MQAANSINSGLNYIEQNLKTTITAEELADMAGYSVWYYRRLFSQTVGMSVNAYISKQRLDSALNEIISGRRAIDAALDYGFDTYAGFYKAFVRAYGSSPKNYLIKTEVSAMLAENDLRNILTEWDVPNDLPIMDIYIMDGTKVSGNVWSVGEDYILKIADSESQLKNIKIAKALAAQGFAASTPILTKSGAEYLDGEKITVLSRGIKGTPLSKADRFGNDRRSFGLKYGDSIARLHQALAATESEIAPHERNLFTHVAEWALPETKKQNIKYKMGLHNSFFDGYINEFGALFNRLPKQLIHGDPNPSNIMFNGGEVSGFIDYDFCRRDVRLWDLCYCATGILSEWRGVDDLQNKWFDVLEGILHGYNNVSPLTPEEKQAVFYVICSIQMICVAYFESVPELKELAKINREMLMFLSNSKSRIDKMF